MTVADWRPSAPIASLRRRAAVVEQLRRFLGERGVLEVETPLLGAATATEPAIESIPVPLPGGARAWLQTSPEHAMKRLLAAGSGPIFEITRSFRGGERGALHDREFTILEWYRPGFDHHALMDEVAALVEAVLGVGERARLTYAQAFERHAGVDPLSADRPALDALGREAGLSDADASTLDRDALLDLAFASRVQPALGPGLTFVTDYPASQAALARVRPGPPAVAERFEAFVDGIELANGYHELADAGEQRRRMESDAARRRARGLADVAPDTRLLAALAHGLPDCAGVALGVDRLVMRALNADTLDDVRAFASERA